MIRPIAFVLAALILSACGSAPVNQSEPPASNSRGAAEVSRPAQQTDANAASKTGASAAAACYNVDTKPKVVLKSQTFAMDFEPFRNSCFVTFHDAEYTNPPLNSEIAIFKDGKNVFEFADQFNGVSVGCWVEAVAFQDVNADRTTDIIVVGKCSGKSDSYHENTVYLNDGKTFVTNADANYRLADLRTIKDISDYIRKNPVHFSLTADAANSNS